jgi:hypothetical protein
MKKSTRVTLTVLAGVGCAAAQQAADPCGPGTFNPAACHAAVKAHGYCEGNVWVPQQYQQYPYYYDLYRTYSAAGGTVMPAPTGACRAGGFGGHGIVAMLAHSHPGS